MQSAQIRQPSRRRSWTPSRFRAPHGTLLPQPALVLPLNGPISDHLAPFGESKRLADSGFRAAPGTYWEEPTGCCSSRSLVPLYCHAMEPSPLQPPELQSAADSEIIVAEVATDDRAQPSPNDRLGASRWQVLALLFLAAGPLALPVLFRSPRFSRFWKMVLLALVILQTTLVVVVLVVFSRWFLGQLGQLRHALPQ